MGDEGDKKSETSNANTYLLTSKVLEIQMETKAKVEEKTVQI